MLLKPIVDTLGNMPERDVEEMANEIVLQLSKEPEMTYEKACEVIKAHEGVFKEARSHLYHNASVELKDKGITFVLEPY